jgi:hypothetical protein
MKSETTCRRRAGWWPRLQWDETWLAALRVELQSGASWRAMERKIGISRKSIQDHAFLLGWVTAPSRSSRFGIAWHRAQQ